MLLNIFCLQVKKNQNFEHLEFFSTIYEMVVQILTNVASLVPMFNL